MAFVYQYINNSDIFGPILFSDEEKTILYLPIWCALPFKSLGLIQQGCIK